MKLSPLFLIGGIALGYFLLAKKQAGAPPGETTTSPPVIAIPTPTPGSPTPGSAVILTPTSSDVAVVLGGRILEVGSGMFHDRHFGEHVQVSVRWVPEVRQRRGLMVAWDYFLYIGLGRPESPWPGRQFQPEGSTVFYSYKGVVGGSPRTTIHTFGLQPEYGYTLGKKDILVSLVAPPTPSDPSQGADVSGIWPHVSVTEGREIASLLVQDAIEIKEGPPNLASELPAQAFLGQSNQKSWLSLRG